MAPIMIELLDPKEWYKLEAIFGAEWNACLPDPAHAMIITETEDGELIGFVTLESVMLVANAYVAENHRGLKGVRTIKRLTGHIREKAKHSGRAFLMIGHNDRGPRYENFFKALGLRKLADAVYRCDFFKPVGG